MADKRVFVGDLTRTEFRQRMESGEIEAAIVPVGATEQHNEHLAMIHDAFHVTHVAEQAARRLHPRVVVASPVSIGVSEQWMEHIGTLTVRPEIFCEYVYDVCDSLRRAGVGNILILNGHGGNVKPIMRRIDEYRERLGLNLRFQSYWDVCDPALVFSTMEANRLPGHACEFETSTMMALAPERVHTALMVNEAAKLATKEKGELLIGHAVSGVADVLDKMIAGESVDKPPVTFAEGQRIHMVTGDRV